MKSKIVLLLTILIFSLILKGVNAAIPQFFDQQFNETSIASGNPVLFNVTVIDADGNNTIESVNITLRIPNATEFNRSLTRISPEETGMVVYREGTSTLRHRLFKDTSWDPEGSPNSVGELEWIKVVAHPSKLEKILATKDSLDDVNVQVWNGTGWGTVTEVSADSSLTGPSFDVCYEQVSGDALVFYTISNTDNTPKYRVWNGTDWSVETSASNVGGGISTIRCIPDSNSDRIALMTKDLTDDVNAQIWMGDSFGNLTELETSGSGCDRCFSFDGAWESSSGDFMAIWWGDGTDDVEYKKWTLSGGWGTEGDIWSTGINSGPNHWIRAKANPNSSSNEIVVADVDDGGDLNTAIWNGSSWGNTQEPDVSVTTDTRMIADIAYEESSYTGMIVWSTDVGSLSYRTWRDSWSGTGTTSSIVSTGQWIQLDSKPNSDKIMLTTVDDANDVNSQEWDGSSWGSVTEHEIDSDYLTYHNAWFTYSKHLLNTWETVITDTSKAGTYNVTYIYASDTDENINTTQYFDLSFESSDVISPQFFNITESPTHPATYSYGATYRFNITVTDNDQVDTVIFEHNFTNGNVIIVASNESSEYYVEITNLKAVSGSYTWTMNDTTGNENTTTSVYNVNKATPSLTLSLDGNSSTPQTRTFPNETDVQSSESNEGDTDLTYTLVKNGTSISNGLQSLTPEVYNFTYFVNAGENYTADSKTIILTLNKAVPNLHLELNGTAGDKSYSFGELAFISGFHPDIKDGDMTFNLYRNGTLISVITTYNRSSLTIQSGGDPNSSLDIRSNTLSTNIQQYDVWIDSLVFGFQYVFYNDGVNITNVGSNNQEAECRRNIGTDNQTFIFGEVGDGQNTACIKSKEGVVGRLYPYLGPPYYTMNFTLYNYTEMTNDLEIGTYNYTFNTTGGTNYTSASISRLLTVSQTTPSLSISFNDTSPIIYGTALKITGSENNDNDADLSYVLKRNGTTVSNPEEILLPTGLWEWEYSTTGGTNYTSGSTTDTFTINKNTSEITVTINPGTVSYPTTSDIGCSISTGDSGATLTLYRNGTSISSGSGTRSVTENPGVGIWNYTCIYTESENYTESSSIDNYLTVNKGTPSISVSPTTTVTYGTSIQTGCERVAGDSSSVLTLYRNDTLVSSGVGTPQNESAIVLAAGEYNYTCTISSTENYTASSSVNNYRTINRNTLQLILTGTSPITYGTAGDVQGTESNTGDSDVVYGLYIDNSSVNNPDNIIRGVGTYNYIYNGTTGENWTTNTTSFALTINTDIPNVVIAGSNVTYPTSVNIQVSEDNSVDSDLTYTLHRNGTVVSPPDTTELEAGLYNYTYFTNGGTNFTSNSNQTWINISKATPNINIEFSGGINSAVNNTVFYIGYGSTLTVKSIINITKLGQITDTNFKLYQDGNEIGTRTNNVDEFSSSTLSVGRHYFNSTFFGNQNYSLFTRDPEAEVTAPQYWDLEETPSDPQTYSAGISYYFNSSWNTSNSTGSDLDTVIIEFNDTYPISSTLVNTTVTTFSGDIDNRKYQFSVVDLPAGEYIYKWYANDTNDGWNITPQQTYTINKASPFGGMSITGTGTFVYPYESTVEGVETNDNDADLTYNLFRDNNFVSNPETNTFPSSIYTYIFNTSGGQNYSSGSAGTETLIIQKAPTKTDLYLNGTKANKTYGPPLPEGANFTVVLNISGKTVKLDTNLTDWLTQSTTTPLENLTSLTETGLFNITGYFEGDENYTASSETWYANAVSNVAPTIPEIYNISEVNPTEGSETPVTFWFLAKDDDGTSDLNDTQAKARFNKTGESIRSTSCSAVGNIDSTTRNYTCTINMKYFDLNGVWTINVSITDSQSEYVENKSISFTYNPLTAMTINVSSINFGSSLTLGQQDVEATDDPILLNNTGNQAISDGNVKVKAFDLNGATYSSDYIPAGNFESNINDAAGGTSLVNNTAIGISGATLPRGTTATEELFFYLDVPANGLRSQIYNSLSNWILSIS